MHYTVVMHLHMPVRNYLSTSPPVLQALTLFTQCMAMLTLLTCQESPVHPGSVWHTLQQTYTNKQMQTRKCNNM